MNLENKKQLMTLGLAVILGIVAVVAMAQNIQSQVNNQTRQLAKEYAGKNQALAQEVQANLQALNNKIEQQKAVIARQEQELKRQIQIAAAAPRQEVAAGPSKEEVEEAVIFSVVTPPGKRAYTISIPTLNAVGGLISPGDHIDIFADLSIPKGGKTENIASVLFQKVLVLSVNGYFKPIGDKAIYDSQGRSASLRITLALTPEEVNLIRFAQKHGFFEFSLRSPAEQNTETFEVASWETLSEYVLNNSGMSLEIPKKKKAAPVVEDEPDDFDFEEQAPQANIEIFRAGRAL